MFLLMAEHHFWHGTSSIGPRMALAFYFVDIDMGLAEIFRDITDTHIELVRFSLIEVPAGRAPRAVALLALRSSGLRRPVALP